jgi:amidase
MGPDTAEVWSGLVTRLVVTRSVRDTAGILDAVAGPAPGDPYFLPPPERPWVDEVGADPGRLRIGLRRRTPRDATAGAPEVIAALEEAGRLLESLGHHVDPDPADHLDEEDMADAIAPCLGVWTSSDLDWFASVGGRPVTADDVEPITWLLAELGRATTGSQYQTAIDRMSRYTRRIAGWWHAGNDVLVTPTIPELPPPLGSFASPDGDPLHALLRASELVSFTMPFNITGQPAISVPLYRTPEGLPVGVQLVAATGREDVLLRLAAQLEAAAPWAEHRPDVLESL